MGEHCEYLSTVEHTEEALSPPSFYRLSRRFRRPWGGGLFLRDSPPNSTVSYWDAHPGRLGAAICEANPIEDALSGKNYNGRNPGFYRILGLAF